jgi:tRNA G10  N-methylase Trm11
MTSWQVLDPFCGSGSTGKACMLEGFAFIGIDNDPASVEIAKARVSAAACSHVKLGRASVPLEEPLETEVVVEVQTSAPRRRGLLQSKFQKPV